MGTTPSSVFLSDLPPIFVLYRYFLAADAMRRYCQEHIRDEQYWRALRAHPEMAYPVVFHLGPPGIGMSYFYSAMYVLVEAWKELGYHDAKIDSLLDSPLLDLLRRFRNATFHFQRNFVSGKWADFIEAGEESSQWIQELRNAFSDFLLRESTWVGITPAIPEELKAKTKGQPIDKVMEIIFSWLQEKGALKTR
jgi:hypothetical protein